MAKCVRLLLDVVYFLCSALVYRPPPIGTKFKEQLKDEKFKEQLKDDALTFSKRAWVRSSRSVHHLGIPGVPKKTLTV